MWVDPGELDRMIQQGRFLNGYPYFQELMDYLKTQVWVG